MKSLSIILLIFGVLAAVPAGAIPIPVTNGSFESPYLTSINSPSSADLRWSASLPISGWAKSSGTSAGVMQPLTTGPSSIMFLANTGINNAAGVVDGVQAAYINNGTLYNNVGPISASPSAEYYTLSVAVGRRMLVGNDSRFPSADVPFSIGMRAVESDTILASYTGSLQDIGAGMWQRYTLVGHINQELLGQTLRIELFSGNALTGDPGQTAFDDIRLSQTPEPVSMIFMATAGGVLLLLTWRRRRVSKAA